MITAFKEHIGFWTPARRKSLIIGILFLVIALGAQFTAGRYYAKSATNFVGDIFLDNLPMVNLDYVIVDGAFLGVIAGVALMLLKPHYLLFSLKVFPFFIIIRSFFVTLTHVGIYPHQITLGENPLDQIYMLLNLQDGFFFSGHTGMTFLAALVFWEDKFWRYFFIVISVIFAIAVLLAHVHYSIDVFAAPFITYAIFKLAQLELFQKDYAILKAYSKAQFNY